MDGPGFEFERPVLELEKRIAQLEEASRRTGADFTPELEGLRSRVEQLKRELYVNLTPWQRVRLARDPKRPDTLDLITLLTTGFVELHGDRCFSDDRAIVAGLCKIGKHRLLLIGHRKGRTTRERAMFNFGSAHPEGYRKALSKMKLAEKLRIPVLTLINTQGAYPGIGAEERGQAQAIALNLMEMARLRTPIVCIVIGEGGSGGALGIGLGDRLAILENAYYSVISPEGCAAILWKDGSKAPLAAEVLRLAPKDLLALGIVDEIIPEPAGGAQRDHLLMAETLKDKIIRYFDELTSLSIDELLEKRYQKYRKIGVFLSSESGALEKQRPPLPGTSTPGAPEGVRFPTRPAEPVPEQGRRPDPGSSLPRERGSSHDPREKLPHELSIGHSGTNLTSRTVSRLDGQRRSV